MTTLRVLNVQFNKLQQIENIPEWVSCKVIGNESLHSRADCGEERTLPSDTCLLDWDFTESAELSVGTQGPGVLNPTGQGSLPSSTGHVTQRAKQSWKKQDNQQQQARQDRFNMSRKHRSEECEEGTPTPVIGSNYDAGNICETHAQDDLTGQILHEQAEMDPFCVPSEIRGTALQLTYPAVAKLDELDLIKHVQHASQNAVGVQSDQELELEVGQVGNKTLTVEDTCPDCYHEHSPSDNREGFKSEDGALSGNEENSLGNTLAVDRHNDDVVEVYLEECLQDEVRDGNCGSSNIVVLLAGLKTPRRQDSDGDRNPKPTKRRRPTQIFSKVSLKYFIESFVGFDDRLDDGFYDAGRDHRFLPLDELEREQLCFDSREVILVDREKDEDLDVMAHSALQLLAGLQSSGDGNQTENVDQRIAVLALFVSDCFGGSDKALSISNIRRAASGGTAGMPFVCSCSSNSRGIPIKKVTENSTLGTVFPNVHMLCEGAVRFLKAQRRSNILLIGSFSYGVCRHRAILFKYLCDRANPTIPCELVRGFLDYMPHAWNIVLVKNGKSSVRMLVDACRPLDIRQERDPEYFCSLEDTSAVVYAGDCVVLTKQFPCRYIPLKRIQLPLAGSRAQKMFGREGSFPTFHEDIGHGASGAVVRRCTFGTFTAAAKVRRWDSAAERAGGLRKSLEKTCLSELRMLFSLQQHPCVITLYGHEISTGFTSSSDSTAVAPQHQQLVIFMEYMKGGSLERFLKGLLKKGHTYAPPMLALHVARNVACALSFLHSKCIIHRDIKSSNVLIDSETKQELDCSTPVVKLCDFDSAVPLQSSSVHTCYMAHRGVPPADVCVGTPRWIAPEVLRAMHGRHSYGLEADIWSFGCLLVELLTLKIPYDGLMEEEVHSHIQIGQRPQLPCELDKLRISSSGVHESAACGVDNTQILSILVRLFHSCTDTNPCRRPTAKELLSALESTIACGKACKTSPLDGKTREETPALLELPDELLVPNDQESFPTEDSCLTYSSTGKNHLSCDNGYIADENNV